MRLALAIVLAAAPPNWELGVGASLGVGIGGLGVRQDDGSAFYKFPVGSSWALTEKEGDKESKIELKVTKDEGGRIFIESKELKGEGKEPKITTIVWWAQDGHLVWGSEREGKVEGELRFYKVGSKKGDTWEAAAGEHGPKEGKAEHMGPAEVKVPAGTYKDATHVRIKFETQQIDMFWVAKVGLVKMDITREGKPVGGVQLAEFKEPK